METHALKAAFTLVELLAALSIAAVLLAVALPAASRMNQYAARAQAASNMRQIGVAAHLYANDNNQQFPGHPDPGSSADLWPKLFCNYLSPSDPRVFLDGSDPVTAKLPLADVISNTVNNTGYIYNGFDDLAAGNVPPKSVPLNRLGALSQVVLLSQKSAASKTFYVDLLLPPLTDLLSALNPQAYNGGSYYLYADGSVRFAKQSDYSNSFWVVDKTLPLPLFPLPLPLPPLPLGLGSEQRFAGVP